MADKLLHKAPKEGNDELTDLSLALQYHLEQVDGFVAIPVLSLNVLDSVLDARKVLTSFFFLPLVVVAIFR